MEFVKIYTSGGQFSNTFYMNANKVLALKPRAEAVVDVYVDTSLGIRVWPVQTNIDLLLGALSVLPFSGDGTSSSIL